ncbi:MAG: hypothetical protein ACK561_10010 [Pseudomonadaceae bacterium]
MNRSNPLRSALTMILLATSTMTWAQETSPQAGLRAPDKDFLPPDIPLRRTAISTPM